MSDHDPTDFVDNDFQSRKAAGIGALGTGIPSRAPTREEMDSRVLEAQQRLAELKRAQEDLERQRSAIEETRRRRLEFETGRQELVHHLTRGLGLLEEAEFNSRRDAEQMAAALTGLREGLTRLESIHEDAWTKDNFDVELTRALTAVENARMEWNTARLKFPVLTGEAPANTAAPAPGQPAAASPFAGRSFGEWCKIGLAMTWPLVLSVLACLAVMILLLLRH
jgi:hypothetical protein